MTKYDTIKELLDNMQKKATELLELIDGNSATWWDLCFMAVDNQPNSADNTEILLNAISKINTEKLASLIVKTDNK